MSQVRGEQAVNALELDEIEIASQALGMAHDVDGILPQMQSMNHALSMMMCAMPRARQASDEHQVDCRSGTETCWTKLTTLAK